jgi:hypothetical protein
METIVIGVDAATRPAKVGLCRARWSGRETTLLDPPRCGKAKESIAATLAEWIGHLTATGRRVLLAIDAPLGWPRILRVALSDHDAGAPLAYSANEMFWRRTDHILTDRFGMQPFSVAADRIARTSHATLRCLEEVRQATGRTLPLVWAPDFEGVGVIGLPGRNPPRAWAVADSPRFTPAGTEGSGDPLPRRLRSERRISARSRRGRLRAGGSGLPFR